MSELSNQRVRTPADVVKEGQTVAVRVLDVDGEGRRMSLSMRSSGGGGKQSVGGASGNAAAATVAAPAAPLVAKKRPKLRGGLEF